MGFHFRRHKLGVSPSIGRRDEEFMFGPGGLGTPVERTPIRQGRSKTGGLLLAASGVGLLLVIIAFFVE